MDLWPLWSLLYYELVIWMCYLCDIYCIMNLLYWSVYRSYSRFRPLPVYFPYRTFISEVSEISISFPFPKVPFSISILIKNMKTVMFTDRLRPFSSLMKTMASDQVCPPYSKQGRVHERMANRPQRQRVSNQLNVHGLRYVISSLLRPTCHWDMADIISDVTLMQSAARWLNK